MVLIEKKYRIAIFFVLLMIIGGVKVVNAQELDQLRSERQKQLDEIAYTEKLLSKATSDKRSRLSELKLLSRQISSRAKVLANIRMELGLLDRSIKNREREVNLLKDELIILKQDYARMIFKAYQTRKSYDIAQYILAANDFNQAYKRVKYLQQYGKFRKQQAKEIREKTVDLQRQVSELAKSHAQQKRLLSQRQKEVTQLNNRKKDKDQYVKRLSKTERSLRKQLDVKKRARDRIEEEMNRIIAAASGGAGGDSGLVLTPEMKIISNEFGNNRGRLPWPVERGVITGKYGLHKHEVLKNIKVDNKGVDITTNGGDAARAVFEGRVSNVLSIRGANLTIIIQHGEYFTVYQNLMNLKIKKGDLVQRKQLLGEIYKERGSSTSELHFELWKGKMNQNPELWLAR